MDSPAADRGTGRAGHSRQSGRGREGPRGPSWRVRWRYGGTRDGDWQTVTYRDAGLREVDEGLRGEPRALRPRQCAGCEGTVPSSPGHHRLGVGRRWTFGEVAQRYIDTRTTSKANTKEAYARIVRLHLADWDDRPIGDITSDDVAGLVNRLQAQGKSVAAIFDFTRSVFRYANNVEPPLRAGNPCALVRVQRSRKRTETFLSEEEAALLLAACDDLTLPMVDTLLGTGLRFSELLGLRVRDLRFGKRPSLSVVEQIRRAQGGIPAGPGEPKSEASKRTIALDDDLAAVLRQQAKGKRPEDHLFTNPSTGQFWHQNAWVARCWEPTLARAVESGLTTRPRIHDLRHTHASWLLTDGVPLLVVSAGSGMSRQPLQPACMATSNLRPMMPCAPYSLRVVVAWGCLRPCCAPALRPCPACPVPCLCPAPEPLCCPAWHRGSVLPRWLPAPPSACLSRVGTVQGQQGHPPPLPPRPTCARAAWHGKGRGKGAPERAEEPPASNIGGRAEVSDTDRVRQATAYFRASSMVSSTGRTVLSHHPPAAGGASNSLTAWTSTVQPRRSFRCFCLR